jgi:hypothetical protein
MEAVAVAKEGMIRMLQGDPKLCKMLIPSFGVGCRRLVMLLFLILAYKRDQFVLLQADSSCSSISYLLELTALTMSARKRLPRSSDGAACSRVPGSNSTFFCRRHYHQEWKRAGNRARIRCNHLCNGLRYVFPTTLSGGGTQRNQSSGHVGGSQ